MKTELCDLLGIEYPVIQGAMAHISDGKLAGAVSEAGGLGVIATGFENGDFVRQEVAVARSITSKPFAVNIIMESSVVDEVVQAVIDEKVPVVTISAGKPDAIIPPLVDAGVKVICLIPNAHAAQRVAKLGVCAVVAEGLEGGGHIGRMTTLPMVRQVVKAVDIPVIAAGGIADGAGFMAALMLGAVGVQMGTAFLVADECGVDKAYKQMVIDAKDSDTVLTGLPGAKQVRCIKNPFTDGFWDLYHKGATAEELDEYCTGSIARAHHGDLERGAFSAGMISGLIHETKPARKIITDIMDEADTTYANFKKIYG